MQVITLVPHIFYNNKLCEVGELIDVSEAAGMAMVMRDEVVEITDDVPEGALIEDDEKPKKPAKKGAKK